MSTAQDLREMLEPVLVALGLVDEDVSVTPAGKRRSGCQCGFEAGVEGGTEWHAEIRLTR